MPPLFFVSNRSESDLFSRSGRPVDGPAAGLLRELELWDLVSDLRDLNRVSRNQIKSGPGGNPGLIFSVGSLDGSPADPSYDPDRQDWQQVSGSVWIAGDCPGPADLERHSTVVQTVENVQLENGSIWEVPVIRQPVDQANAQLYQLDLQPSNLPSVLYRDVERNWVMQVVPKHQALWNESRRLFGCLLDGEPCRFVDLMQFAIDVLSLRYRFNGLLHSRWPADLLTTGNVQSVVRAAVGFGIVSRFMDGEKKKRHD